MKKQFVVIGLGRFGGSVVNLLQHTSFIAIPSIQVNTETMQTLNLNRFAMYSCHNLVIVVY